MTDEEVAQQAMDVVGAITAHLISSMPKEAGLGAARGIEAGAVSVVFEVLHSPAARLARCTLLSGVEIVAQWQQELNGGLRFLQMREPGQEN